MVPMACLLPPERPDGHEVTCEADLDQGGPSLTGQPSTIPTRRGSTVNPWPSSVGPDGEWCVSPLSDNPDCARRHLPSVVVTVAQRRDTGMSGSSGPRDVHAARVTPRRAPGTTGVGRGRAGRERRPGAGGIVDRTGRTGPRKPRTLRRSRARWSRAIAPGARRCCSVRHRRRPLPPPRRNPDCMSGARSVPLHGAHRGTQRSCTRPSPARPVCKTSDVACQRT